MNDPHDHPCNYSRGIERCNKIAVTGCVLRDIGERYYYCQDHGGPSPAVNHPSHYGGADNPYEAIKVIRAWNLGFALGNTVKYISRAGKKDPKKLIEDLEKAAWYLKDEIETLKRNA